MPVHAIVALKPGLDAHPLLDLTRDVIDEGGTIHLVAFVVVGKDDDERERLEAETRQLDAIAADLRGAGYQTKVTVQISTNLGLGTELARLADHDGADLLVIGLAKRSRVGKALMGSDAQGALMHANCPVLTLRLS
jgi:nucleotide-binding universal stress UspA family protein